MRARQRLKQIEVYAEGGNDDLLRWNSFFDQSAPGEGTPHRNPASVLMFDLFRATELREAPLGTLHPLRELLLEIRDELLERQWMSRGAIKNEMPAVRGRPFRQQPGRRIDTNDDVTVGKLLFRDTTLESLVPLEHNGLLVLSSPQATQG